MIGNLLCYDCFDFWLLLFVVLFIGIYHCAISYFRDKQAIQDSAQNNSHDSYANELMNKSHEEILKDLLGTGSFNYRALVMQVEMTRRLIVELIRFNQASTLFSIALITLAIVQIVLVIIQLLKH